ncbi:hypothetical protein ACFOD9_11935 [Novosphingobium bradum]|uniref:EthD domain-containing protein n=1 Tax=Novosphingobium bradum TaxID=1737444 RepID=A0ABV7ITT0_9SPHN
MFKFTYLMKRKPGFTPDQFNSRWRQHGALGMSTPFADATLVYVQAEPLRPAPIAGASLDYDAVAWLVVADEAFAPDPSPQVREGQARMAEDETHTFDGACSSGLFFVHPKVLVAGDPGGFTAFLYYADAGKAEAAAEAFVGQPGLSRLVVNLRRDDMALPQPCTLPYRAVVEVAASSVRGLKQVIEGTPLPAQPDLLVATREVVFWDKLSRA